MTQCIVCILFTSLLNWYYVCRRCISKLAFVVSNFFSPTGEPSPRKNVRTQIRATGLSNMFGAPRVTLHGYCSPSSRYGLLWLGMRHATSVRLAQVYASLCASISLGSHAHRDRHRHVFSRSSNRKRRPLAGAGASRMVFPTSFLQHHVLERPASGRSRWRPECCFHFFLPRFR